MLVLPQNISKYSNRNKQKQETKKPRTLYSPKEVLSFPLSNRIKIPLARRKRNKHTNQPSKSLQNELAITFQASCLELSLMHLPFHHFTLSTSLSPSPYMLNISSTDILEKLSIFTNSFPPHPLYSTTNTCLSPFIFFQRFP